MSNSRYKESQDISNCWARGQANSAYTQSSVDDLDRELFSIQICLNIAGMQFEPKARTMSIVTTYNAHCCQPVDDIGTLIEEVPYSRTRQN